jgi:hypothetical protein
MKAEAKRLAARLAELRAALVRVEQRRLEDGDWAVVRAMYSELIEQAEPGQQWVTIEFSDEDEASSGTDETVASEESTE